MSTRSSPARVCRITRATLGAMDHSRAAFTMWLLAAMTQMSSARLISVTRNCPDRIRLEPALQPQCRNQHGRKHDLEAEHRGARLQEALRLLHCIQQRGVPEERKHDIQDADD